MHSITDLSQLLSILSGEPNQPIELSIDAALQESLLGCIKLGLQDLIRHVPGALPPRVAEPFVNKPGSIPKMLVKASDFADLVLESGSSNERVKVTGNLLEHAMAWVEISCQAPRVETMIAELTSQVEQGPEVVDVKRADVQEIIDWLDQIQRNEPNDLANELRQDINKLNNQGMLGKIKWTDYRWD